MTRLTTDPTRANESLRAIRKYVGMTQAEFAAALGLKSWATISHYENRKRRLPVEVLVNAADLAGYELRFLFKEKRP